MAWIPSHAQKVLFQFGRTMSGQFYVWETKGGKWQWDAFGNNGEAPTKELAIDSARMWIMDDYDPLQPKLKTLYTIARKQEIPE